MQTRLERTSRWVHRGLAAASVTATVIAASAIPAAAATTAGQQVTAPMAEAPPAVFGWGFNAEGELGDGTITPRSSPMPVTGLPSGVRQVTVTHLSSAALVADGTVDTWGGNLEGELGDPKVASSGRLLPGEVRGLTGITQISGGSAHMLALASDGTVWAWGRGNEGQLGDGNTAESDLPVKIPGLTGVTQVAAGAQSSYALRSDGTVWSWGNNRHGELGTGTKDTETDVPGQIPGLTGITQIAAGHDVAASDGGLESVFALRSDGTLAGWGYNEFGQLGNGSTADSAVPVTVPGLTGVTQVSSSGIHTLAIAGSNHQVLAWGNNFFGELGNGTFRNSSTPEPIPLTGVTQVSAGQVASAAVRSDGTLLTWGNNDWGQLGRAGSGPQLSPLAVPGLTNVSQVLMGSLFALAIGQPASTVPDLTGLVRSAATQALSIAGLTLGGVHTLIDPTCTSIGKVIIQDPDPGTIVPTGTEVFIWLGARPSRCLPG